MWLVPLQFDYARLSGIVASAVRVVLLAEFVAFRESLSLSLSPSVLSCILLQVYLYPHFLQATLLDATPFIRVVPIESRWTPI